MFTQTKNDVIRGQRDILWGALVSTLTRPGKDVEGDVARAIREYTDARGFPPLETHMMEFVAAVTGRVLSIRATANNTQGQAAANRTYRIVAAHAALLMKGMDFVLIRLKVQRKPKDAVLPDTLEDLINVAPAIQTPAEKLTRTIRAELTNTGPATEGFIAEHVWHYLTDTAEIDCYTQPEITRREIIEAVRPVLIGAGNKTNKVHCLQRVMSAIDTYTTHQYGAELGINRNGLPASVAA